MERLRAKLKSQRGASITYGLLLFLICAVLSSVILVAATAAAGRISNLAETDQRYYSVTSAAELIKQVLEKQESTIVKNELYSKIITYGENGEISESEPVLEKRYIYLIPKEVYDLDYNIIDSGEENTTYDLIYSGVTDDSSNWKDLISVDTLQVKDQPIYLSKYFARRFVKGDNTPFTLSLVPDKYQTTIIDGRIDLDPSGKTVATLQIRNVGEKPFIMTEMLEADVQDSYDNMTVKEENAARDENKVTVMTREVTKTYISWDITDVSVIKPAEVE